MANFDGPYYSLPDLSFVITTYDVVPLTIDPIFSSYSLYGGSGSGGGSPSNQDINGYGYAQSG